MTDLKQLSEAATRAEALKEAKRIVTEGERHVPTRIKAFTDAGLSPSTAMRAMNGSLDAAKTLHEAVLPSWEFGVTYNEENGAKPSAFVAVEGGELGFEATNKDPARAWLLAILKALIAQSEAEGE